MSFFWRNIFVKLDLHQIELLTTISIAIFMVYLFTKKKLSVNWLGAFCEAVISLGISKLYTEWIEGIIVFVPTRL